MTRDDIIRMADAAGIPGWDDHEPLTQDMLERFAALVAAAERERIAIWCESNQVTRVLRGGGYTFMPFGKDESGTHEGTQYAAAIRART